MMADRIRQIAGVVTYGTVLWLNGLAGSGALSGESIGVIANRYPSYFLPANYVFGIWSLIYLMLLVFTVYQALPGGRGSAVLHRVGWWWVLSGLLNMAWIVTFSFGVFGSALLVMLGLLATLIIIQNRIGPDSALTWTERVAVSYPFALYVSWISIATISNTFQFVTYREWSFLAINGPLWSASMVVVATGLAAMVVWKWRIWIAPLVVTWALVGIALRFADVPVISRTAWVMTVVGLAVLPSVLRSGRAAREVRAH
jgi:hypothetical protein